MLEKPVRTPAAGGLLAPLSARVPHAGGAGARRIRYALAAGTRRVVASPTGSGGSPA